MTRINLIPVEELSDQHLMAEYRELPRIVNGVIEGKFKPSNVPEHYILGTGHVKFFTNKIVFLAARYRLLFAELQYREFKLNAAFLPDDMFLKIELSGYQGEQEYIFSKEELALSRGRIIEKIEQKPKWYRWSKRLPPEYAK